MSIYLLCLYKKEKNILSLALMFATIKPGNLYKGLEAIFLDIVDFFCFRLV